MVHETIQGGVAHIYTVGGSATAVKLKVRQRSIRNIFKSQRSSYNISLMFLAIKLARASSMQSAATNKNFRGQDFDRAVGADLPTVNRRVTPPCYL